MLNVECSAFGSVFEHTLPCKRVDACATRCARTWRPTSRSACCCRAGVDSGTVTALAASELARPLKTFSVGFTEPSFDELARRAPGRPPLRHRAPRARRRAGGRGRAARGRGHVRRAARRLDRAAVLARRAARGHARSRPCCPARAATSCSAATRPTWPTACRRLARPLAAAAARCSRAGPAPSRRLSLDFKLRRLARGAGLPAARAPSRVQGDVLAARRAPSCSRPGAAGRPARRLPAPLRRDRGRRAGGAPAGPRRRDVPGRRPARADRPRRDGARARDPRPVPRPGRGRARARAAGAARACAGCRPSRCCARRAAPLLPAGDRPRPQARLLRPGGRVAARAAAAAGARAAGARQDPRARAGSSPPP